jgi:hypothetical protein
MYKPRQISLYLVSCCMCCIFTITYLSSSNSRTIVEIPLFDMYLGPELSSSHITKTEYPELVITPHIPEYRSLLEVVTEWNPDIPDNPPVFKEVLHHFNYSNPIELKIAESYRNAELPFKLFNVPDVDSVTTKWTDAYLSKKLKTNAFIHVEKSDSNHFMYWNGKAAPEGYKAPTTVVSSMTFSNWRKIARNADITKPENKSEHFYFMTGSSSRDKPGSSFISEDLPFFGKS